VVALEQAMVVRLGVEPADTDGQEAGPCRIRVQIGFDVGRMHNLCQASERGVVAEPEVVDENLEGALAGAMCEFGVRSVEGPCTLGLRRAHELVSRHVEKLCVVVDETANEPRAGDPIGLRSGPRHPTSS
jgi:hypothetical protein